MGDAKRSAEAIDKRRQKKITFLREHTPDYVLALVFSGSIVLPDRVLDRLSDLFECLEERCRQIASGEDG